MEATGTAQETQKEETTPSEERPTHGQAPGPTTQKEETQQNKEEDGYLGTGSDNDAVPTPQATTPKTEKTT